MPRRLQAITLLLLLVLSPIAGWSCGIHCIAMTAHFGHAQATAVQQHACVSASACCPTKPTLCGATSALESSTFLPAGVPASHEFVASFLYAVPLLPLATRSNLARTNSSPPHQVDNIGNVPLRI
jgi:hypothetical protein